MPNDAKLGMVFGVGLVILVAVIFFRKDTTAADAFATIPKSAPAVTQPPPRPSNLCRLREKDRPGHDRSEGKCNHHRLDQIVGGQKHRPRR